MCFLKLTLTRVALSEKSSTFHTVIGTWHSQLYLFQTLWGIVKMLESQKARITEIQIIEMFCWQIFKGPENLFKLHEFELNRVGFI